MLDHPDGDSFPEYLMKYFEEILRDKGIKFEYCKICKYPKLEVDEDKVCTSGYCQKQKIIMEIKK